MLNAWTELPSTL